MNQFKARIIFLSALLVIAAGAVVARLFYIQVIKADEFAARSRIQSQQRCILPAQRGTIYDRTGRILAISTLQEDVSLRMDVFGLSAPGEGDTPLLKRTYPFGEAEGAVVGYVGKDGYGLGGAEFTFDKYLRGEDGWTILQRDGRNHRYRKIGLPNKEPRKGGDVHLTIDAEIQKIAHTVVRQTVEATGARGGLCIVMEPRSGRILAMTSSHTFDPNYPSRFPLERRQNPCINAIFEPGSTFKVITAAAALQDKIAVEEDLFDGNNGVFEIYRETIRDHNPYGMLTFEQAMAYSSNVCFAKIATRVGSDRLFRFTQDFGFGSRTGIRLPGEECGIVHPVRKWSGRTLVTMAMGQELSVTFLQIMTAYGAVANGGLLMEPLICEKIVDGDGHTVEKAKPKPVRRVMSESTAKRLCAMLQTVVDSGTGKNAAIARVAVAGKTGTAQKLEGGGYSKTRSWASFIGFLPRDNPELLCGVVIDEPANNLMASSTAAPAFRKIVSRIISHPRLEYAEMVLDSDLPKKTKKPFAELDSDRTAPRETGKPGRVPRCIGRDARDAVNMMNLQGFTPKLVGTGIVRRQRPAPGVSASPAQPCTLVCSFEG